MINPNVNSVTERLAFIKSRDMPLADFIAPLSLEECLKRVENWRSSGIELKTSSGIEEVSADEYTFWLRWNGTGSRQLNLKFDGIMRRQDATTTHITVTRDYEKNNNLKISLAIAVVGLIAGIVLQSVLWMIALGGGGFALFYVSAYDVERSNNRRMVAHIQEMFGVRIPDDKAKNESS